MAAIPKFSFIGAFIPTGSTHAVFIQDGRFWTFSLCEINCLRDFDELTGNKGFKMSLAKRKQPTLFSFISKRASSSTCNPFHGSELRSAKGGEVGSHEDGDGVRQQVNL